MKIYTKGGDLGETATLSGRRVQKTNIRVHTGGSIDELNSILGVVLSSLDFEKLGKIILRVQKELIDVGADISQGPITKSKHKMAFRVNEDYTSRLESEIDKWEKELSEIKYFILPGGSTSGALLHFARSICRRAERDFIGFVSVEKANPSILVYLNRLSDWLFVLARYVNKMGRVKEKDYGK